MEHNLDWEGRFRLDLEHGFVGTAEAGTGEFSPRLVLNSRGNTVEHAIVEELKKSRSFTFSVAFISPGAIAQLKQHLLEFRGHGRIITSDFLGFNSPEAFSELLHLRNLLGIDVLRYTSRGFHPKGYVFEQSRSVTAMIGSSNLTNSALSRNHEWNLKVSAAIGSELSGQLKQAIEDQATSSEPLTQDWIDDYAVSYLTARKPAFDGSSTNADSQALQAIQANAMQREALIALSMTRSEGAERAIIVSATGTGKTMLSAFDVKAFNPERLLFIVHREQILDRTIKEYQRVLGASSRDYGKLTGQFKEHNRRYVFATIQTLSQDSNLAELSPGAFDYIIVDEAHRAAAETYQRVLGHFRPKFLLGMTATPDRTDGFNVYGLFGHNVPYEIRLNDALEAEILCPFHYYGVSDVTFEDGTTTSDLTGLDLLTSPQRVEHLLKAIHLYSQSGVPPKGLIFCSRKEEAWRLSDELNGRESRGKRLRTVALTGDDSIENREQRVSDLENGLLDYILTVDVFNEGVDIPSVNQVIMLRQTQSAIVFVQQLGRGLRLADGKDYLVVIDMIGNYTNNFMIPIALFGDDSLNRESLRERLNEKVEAGALPGLSSISFDEISRDRILRSITQTRLDSTANLKRALVFMKNRVGRVPTLWDFYRFKSVDPVLLATTREHYVALAAHLLDEEQHLTESESRALSLLSREIMAGKRLQEFVLLKLLIRKGQVTRAEISNAFEEAGLEFDLLTTETAIDTLVLRGYPQQKIEKYVTGVAEVNGDAIGLTAEFQLAYASSTHFTSAVDDLIKTGEQLTRDRYDLKRQFTPGMQYTRYDAAHILGWYRKVYSTIYGYRIDKNRGVCAIFVTLEKSEEITASTAYQDQLIDPLTMRWFTKSNRTMGSSEVVAILAGTARLHVFVKKDDAEGGNHYYLGEAEAHDPKETTMPNSNGKPLPVVNMLLRFNEPVAQGLFDYFSSSARP